MYVRIGDRKFYAPKLTEGLNDGQRAELIAYLKEILRAQKRHTETALAKKHAMPDFFADMLNKGFKGEL